MNIKPVAGYEAEYAVSDTGVVFSVRRRNKVRATQINRYGYEQVVLLRGGGAVTKYVHRLVAEAFLGVAPGMEVNHKNGIRSDNAADNLEWVTKSQNIKHSFRVLKRSPPRGMLGMKATPAMLKRLKGKENSQSIPVIAERAGFGYFFYSIAEAAADLKADESHIVKCLKGVRASHRGFKWQPVERRAA